MLLYHCKTHFVNVKREPETVPFALSCEHVDEREQKSGCEHQQTVGQRTGDGADFLVGIFPGSGQCVGQADANGFFQAEWLVEEGSHPVQRAAQGIGQAAVSLGLARIGFIEGENAIQPEGLGEDVKSLYFILLVVGSLIAFLSMKFIYNIGKKEEEAFASK